MQGSIAVAAVWAALGAVALLLPHQLTYVEGYMLEQAARLAHGGGLYQDPQQAPWIVDNFPPLWIAVLSVGVHLFGPTFAFGRFLTLLSAAALAWLLWWFQRRRGEPAWLALAVVALWLMAPFVVRRSLFVRMDLPALAFMAVGFAALVARPDRRGAAWAALAFAAAVLSRQTSLMAPAAAFVGLWWHGRRRLALELAALTGGSLLLAVLALQTATDGRFLTDVVLHNMGRWSWDRMLRYVFYLLGGHLILLILGGLGVWQAWRRPDLQSRMLVAWAVIAIATVWTIGKPGTASNHFLPLLFAMALQASFGLRYLASRLRTAAPRATAAVMVVQALVLAVPLGAGVAHFVEVQEDEAELVALLRGTPGPVLSENAGALLQSGHEVLLEPRTTLEQHKAGRWDDGPLVRAIEDQNFSVIVTERFPSYRSAHEGMRFTQETWAAIEANYERSHECGKWQVWSPR